MENLKCRRRNFNTKKERKTNIWVLELILRALVRLRADDSEAFDI